jgi:diaminopimelate dehydrogenase
MINIAVAGYGNVGRGVLQAIKKNPDMKLTAVFSRRRFIVPTPERR